MLNETNEVFGRAATRLRGVLHWPDAQSGLGVVVCPPFGEERKSAARVLTQTARGLCRAGLSVLRWDYRATGESDGAIESVHVADWVEDIGLARQHLKQRANLVDVGILGIRFGAALSALVPCTSDPFPFFVTWMPVWTGKACVHESVRRLAATRLVVAGGAGCGPESTSTGESGLDLGGFQLSHSQLADLEQVELPNGAQAKAELVAILDSSSQPDARAANERMCEALTTPSGTRRICHVPCRPFWVTASRFDPQDLVRHTLECLKPFGVHAERRWRS
jgi:alpha/beta superfamily hydrolase